MTATQTQPVKPVLSDRLRERADALGVALALLGEDGRLTVQSGTNPVLFLLAGTPPFAAALRACWAELRENAGVPIAAWPGVWVTSLPQDRKRRNAGAPRTREESLLVSVMLGPELLESDQFHLACSSARVDREATLAKIDRAALHSQPEAHRLASTLLWMQQDALDLDRRHGELQTMSTQLGESYEELSLLYKLSTSMTVDQPPAKFLTDACHELQQVVGLKWMGLQLSDEETRLNELAGRLFVAGPVGCDQHMLRRIAKGLMVQQPAGGKPLVVDDTKALDIPNLHRIADQLLVVSLMREGNPIGVLFGADKLDGSRISSVDSKLCNSLANSLSIFLENMMLYEDMQAMFMGTLHALTASIDAKDRYTHGHSERVALMSRQLAMAAGLGVQQAERVYLAALVHDVGKIGVPEAVLCKAGKLTVEEFALIKLHPEIGARILQDIHQMNDLIPGVLYHHERWDGRGYPHNLSGQTIPLFGRLICLADSFDAMSSNRTYRKSLDHRQVLEEIRRCSGTQFDPELAALFVELDFAPFQELIRRHQAQHETTGNIP